MSMGTPAIPCLGIWKGTERKWLWRKFRFVDMEVEYVILF